MNSSPTTRGGPQSDQDNSAPLGQPIAININRVHEIAPWSRTTTYKLVAEGRLPARKLGRSTLILLADLEKFIRDLEQVAP